MQILLPVAILGLNLAAVRILSVVIRKMGERKDVRPYRIHYIARTLNLSLTVLFMVMLMFSLGIPFERVSVFLSSAFAVLGVALFAQWSILSNITASLIIFFAFPYRVDDEIQIIDGSERIRGVIEDITLFHVIIRNDGDLVTYPNNLILQKAVIRKAQPGDRDD